MADLKQLYTEQKEQIEKDLADYDKTLTEVKAEQKKLKEALNFINKQLSVDASPTQKA